MSRSVLRLVILLLLVAPLHSCTNNPYRASDKGKNYYYSTFSEPPKHLDPAMSYSSSEYTFLMQVYEPALQYHFLKRPYEFEPLTVEAIPSPKYYDKDGKELAEDAPAEKVDRAVYTLRLKKGILYQNHPCFAGPYAEITPDEMNGVGDIPDFKATGKRELQAADYVYQIKRLAHPLLNCPILSTMKKYIAGLEELEKTLKAEIDQERDRRKKEIGALYSQEENERAHPIWLDMDRFELPGARAIDKYTYEITLRRKYPQFIYWLAMPFFAPVPREADRFFNDPALASLNLKLDNRPVGTGPYRMETFEANSEMVLVRNENYHDDHYPTEGEPADTARGFLQDAGRKMPFIEKAVYKLEKESIPRWNKFLQGYYDSSGIISEAFDQAVTMSSDGKLGLSDSMKEKGIDLVKAVDPTTVYFAFNMMDPVVGGYAEEKAKLRQAISIAVNIEEWIQIFLNGRGIPAQDILPTGFFGKKEGAEGVNPYVYDWDEKEGKPVRKSIDVAKKLLAEAGYPGGKDKDGKPLTLNFDTYWRGAAAKPRFDWLRKQFKKLDIDLQIRSTDYNRFQDKQDQGNFQVFFLGWHADYPDPENFLFLLFGPNGATEHKGPNGCNYDQPEFNELFKKVESMSNTPERAKLIERMIEMSRHDSPWLWGYHPISYGLYHSWYRNAKPLTVGPNNTLKYKAIDPAVREEKRAAWNAPVWWPVVLLLLALIIPAIPAGFVVWRREREVEQA